MHAPYLLYMSYGGVHSSSACSIFTCDGATLSGRRWETLTFMFTLDCAMYTDMWTGYTKYVRYVRWSVCTDIVADYCNSRNLCLATCSSNVRELSSTFSIPSSLPVSRQNTSSCEYTLFYHLQTYAMPALLFVSAYSLICTLGTILH